MAKDGMNSSMGMSPRKGMASGKIKGGDSFGVRPMAEMSAGPNEDHTNGTGGRGAMADGERGIGPGITHTKGMHPAQAAPSHGPTMDNWNRDGKA